MSDANTMPVPIRPGSFTDPSTRFGDVPALAAELALGVAAGAVVASALHRRGLRWTWALCALLAFVAFHSELGGAFAPLTSGALAACRRMRRLEREQAETDDASGGPRVGTPGGSRSAGGGPLIAIAAALRRQLARPGAGSLLRGAERGEVTLGLDRHSHAVTMPLGGAAGGRHTLVIGSTGSGKTVTQTRIALAALARGNGVVVIDPKGDAAMRDGLRDACTAAGRPFTEWSPEGDCVYNAFGRGSDTEIADKALAGERFTEPHYLRQAQRYLGHVVRAMRTAGEPISLAALVEMLDPDCLEALARTLPVEEATHTQVYLDSLTTRQRSDLSGVRDRLAIMAESDTGRWLDPRRQAGPCVDLLEAIRLRAVLYFRLDADLRPLLTQMLASAVLQDLQSAVASLQGQPVGTLVVIDEFSAIANAQVVRLFGRARSAGVSLLLATQELSDLRLPGEERLLERVLGNVSAVVAHRQVVPSSAQIVSALAGTCPGWRITRHSDGRTTRTRTAEPVLAPETVMALDTGCAAVIVPGAHAAPRVVRVQAVDHD